MKYKLWAKNILKSITQKAKRTPSPYKIQSTIKIYLT